MQRAAAVAIALMAYGVMAQAGEVPGMDLRGVYLGTSLKDIKTRFPKLKCGEPPEFDRHVADLTCSPPSGRIAGFDLFGGNRVMMVNFHFIEGKLEGMKLYADPKPSACDMIVSDLNQKFGASSTKRTDSGVETSWIKGTEWLSMNCSDILFIAHLYSGKYVSAIARKVEREKGESAKKRKDTL